MDAPQLVPIPLGQTAQDGLRFLPGLDAGPNGGGEGGRHVVPRGAAVRTPEAHIEMGPMLLALLAVAPWAPAGPIGLRECAEDDAGSQPLEPLQEGRLGAAR